MKSNILLSKKKVIETSIVFNSFSITILVFLCNNPINDLNRKYKIFLYGIACGFIVYYLIQLMYHSTILVIYDKYIDKNNMARVFNKIFYIIVTVGFMCQFILFFLDYFHAHENKLIEDYREILKNKKYPSIDTLNNNDITSLIQKEAVFGIILYTFYGLVMLYHVPILCKYEKEIMDKKNKTNNNTNNAIENQLNESQSIEIDVREV